MRADDLGALPIKALMAAHDIEWSAVEEVYYGCANQAGEDNRNVARMSALTAAQLKPKLTTPLSLFSKHILEQFPIPNR